MTSHHPRATAIRVFALIALNVLITAILGVFAGEKVTFLLKEQLHLSASTVTNLNLLIKFPAYCQPFMGACTDLYPLFGSRRRSYFALAALVCSAAFLALALQLPYALVTTVCCLLIATSGTVLLGVLINAVAVAQGNRLGNFKRIQTLLQMLPLILTAAFAGRAGGFVTEHWSYRAAFGMAAVVALGYLALLPLLDEPAASAAVVVATGLEAKRRKARERWERQALLRRTLADRRLWAVTAFVCYVGFTPSPDTARPYFFTDALHFSKQFVGDLSGWGAAGAILGILVMQFSPRQQSLRRLAIQTAILSTVSYVPLLIIHDALSARIGMLTYQLLLNASIFVYICMWARACPKGFEAVVYGALASAQALFYYICDWLGTHMYDWFGPKSHHTIAQGWYWTVVACILLCLPLFIILPFLPKTDPADDDLLPAEPLENT